MPSNGSSSLSSRLGAVVVHYHREIEAGQLVASLVRDHGLRPENVVLVDNGSDSDLLHISLGPLADTVVVRRLPNVGYGAAVNAGVALLDESLDYAVVLTHEVVLSPDCLVELVERLDADPHIGLVGPLLLDDVGQVWSAGGSTMPWRGIPYNSAKGASREDFVADREVDWLDGAIFLTRRAEFIDLGGVEERFFLYFEDVELGHRVRKTGQSVVCVPSVLASQAPGGHLGTYLATRNVLWLFAIQGRWLAWALYLAESLIRLVIGPLIRPKGAFHRWRERRRGIWDGIRLPRRIPPQVRQVGRSQW